MQNDRRSCKNTARIKASQEDNYKTGCLLEYTNFRKKQKLIAINLSKKQSIDVDPKPIKQINFTANLDIAGNKKCSSLLKKSKKLFWIFHKNL